MLKYMLQRFNSVSFSVKTSWIKRLNGRVFVEFIPCSIHCCFGFCLFFIDRETETLIKIFIFKSFRVEKEASLKF